MSGALVIRPVPLKQVKAAPLLRAHSIATTNDTQQSSITGAKPAGTAEGDLLFAFFSGRSDGGAVVTPPAGWTPVFSESTSFGATIMLAGYYRNAGAGEPAGYTWSTSVARRLALGIVRMDGHDPAAPVDAWSSGHDSSPAATIVTPAVTVATPKGLFLCAAAQLSDSSFTPDPLTTELYDVLQTLNSTFCAYRADAGGTIGALSHTPTTTGEYAAASVVIRPA